MAADAIEDLQGVPNIRISPIVHRHEGVRSSGYHLYAGVSASLTALDATANWLNIYCDIGLASSTSVDFAKEPFVKELKSKKPGIHDFVRALEKLATEIKPYRNEAQHRKGLRHKLTIDASKRLLDGQLASSALREWACAIEEQICGIIEELGLDTSF